MYQNNGPVSNNLLKWLQAYDAMGIGQPSNAGYSLGMPISNAQDPNAAARRFLWAKQQMRDEDDMDIARQKATPPDFFGQQYGGQFQQGMGRQSDYSYAPPVKNWLTKLGG